MEIKELALSEVKMQTTGDDGYRFKGYASVWDGNDSYNDTIKRGAYAGVIEAVKAGTAEMPLLMFGHKHNEMPVGKIVEMKEDDYGLLIECELTKGHSVAEDLKAAIGHGTIKGLSIGYSLSKDDFEAKQEGGRVITNVTYLGEVSVVSFAADRKAKIDLLSVKDALQEVDSLKSLEAFCRAEFNCSREVAKSFVAQAKSVILAANDEQVEIERKNAEIAAEEQKAAEKEALETEILTALLLKQRLAS
ncbi:TPA: HK97 family phage prohead protease [Vibrio parahaemolyticus]|uniref:HK97 family phage prohead protease n=1 Tax=Vibrio harveyi group TaxID=717610 RepID=UPI000D357F4E|nr:HK97 family phage prohead protease [Vibrio parahaemolyticus]ELB1510064.1 HK97 family phage prohead protease [Vibrio alginolyticus]EGU0167937.1 HK97 family phage prohead protease [Vibrio parahaemolyticus]EHH1170566.1 HK97 family phage prohead protease [Vibrio parahaemolyticus]EJY0699855.1 HK97 family phage prohead protease [Vibrio parahaemolyticus]EKB1969534.1 HK97 family phage prohead protease [Vibrio parahaemolyticus]